MAAEQQQPPATAKAGGGSRFAVTCGLLRQYMKEQGGTGAATRCLAPAVGGLMPETADAAAAEEERTTVLELFPQQAGTLKDDHQRKKRKEPADGRAPLTIFYGGRMLVFDDFPAEKAEELMDLAGSGGNTTVPAAALGQPSSLTDMPLARKVSLRRFLEKRKNRIAAADPYPPPAASESSTKPPAVKDEWLCVSSALSLS